MVHAQYVRVLRRLEGRTPVAVSAFCGGGGVDEGIRRCGGASLGFDIAEHSQTLWHGLAPAVSSSATGRWTGRQGRKPLNNNR